MIQSFAFVAIGVLVCWGSGWFGCFYSNRVDKWERDGVIRHGGLDRKVWKEDDSQEFASRIADDRFWAAAVPWFMKIFGALFAVGGIAQLVGLLLK